MSDLVNISLFLSLFKDGKTTRKEERKWKNSVLRIVKLSPSAPPLFLLKYFLFSSRTFHKFQTKHKAPGYRCACSGNITSTVLRRWEIFHIAQMINLFGKYNQILYHLSFSIQNVLLQLYKEKNVCIRIMYSV